jgi:hypothetical protein
MDCIPGTVDLHERHDLEIVDITHAYEESGSPLLETPLFDQVVETDNLMGHLLPGPVDSDEDALLIGRDDHSTCLDTSAWDPNANDSSKVSAHDDTAAHTGYSVIRRELEVGDGVQWHIGGPSSTVDNRQLVPYLLRRVLFGIPWLTLAVRGMRWQLNMTVIRSHDTWQDSGQSVRT